MINLKMLGIYLHSTVKRVERIYREYEEMGYIYMDNEETWIYVHIENKYN